MSKPPLEPGRTAFLDRDGTINESPPEGEYVTSPAGLRLLPGAAAGVRLLNEAPVKVVVVTNQRGIALGRMDERDLAAVHARLESLLAEAGAHLDGIVHCPHHAEACGCRKPAGGMFERAAGEIEGVALAGGAMVGDTPLDIEAGRRLGLTTVRLGATAPDEPAADREAQDLLGAARWLTGA